jgi:hypothetical protein
LSLIVLQFKHSLCVCKVCISVANRSTILKFTLAPRGVQLVVQRSGGMTLATFQRAFDSSFSGAGPHNLLVALDPSSDTLSTHTDREGFALTLSSSGGGATASVGSTTTDRLRVVHGWLEAIGWGVLIPLGIISASALKAFAPAWCAASALDACLRFRDEGSPGVCMGSRASMCWRTFMLCNQAHRVLLIAVPVCFIVTCTRCTHPDRARLRRFHLHRVFNVLGLLLVTAGVAIAWAKFDSLDAVGGTAGSVHKATGVLVIVLGWAQPVGAFFRPKAARPDPETGKLAKRTKKRLAWELLHKGTGYMAVIIGIVAIFTGLYLIRDTFGTIQKTTCRNAYAGLLVFLILVWLAGMVFAFLARKKRRAAARGAPAAPNGQRAATNGHHPSLNGLHAGQPTNEYTDKV